MILYGWKELNLTAYEIEALEVVVNAEYPVEVADDGHVSGSDLPLGEWFSTFAAAKRSAIASFEADLVLVREALRSLRNTAKKDVSVVEWEG